jgi:hypothetical protein
MNDKQPCCETCPYWSPLPDDVRKGLGGDARGECRRHAPITTSVFLQKDDDYDHHDNYVLWPIVIADEWCGDHPGVKAWIKSGHHMGWRIEDDAKRERMNGC